MTTLLLIRHAAHAAGTDTLVGRTPGIALSDQGRIQAQHLAARLATLPIRAVYASPVERAVQTAEPLAAVLGLPVQCCDGLAELDFGVWTGQPFAALAPDPRWQHWNSFRSGAPLPTGELMLAVQARAVATLAHLHQRHPDATVAVVSHAEVIRAAVAHYLGTPLDLCLRIEISPASVSVLGLHPWGARVLGLNHTGELPVTA